MARIIENWEKQLVRRIGLANNSGNYDYFVEWVIKNTPRNVWLDIACDDNLPSHVYTDLSMRLGEMGGVQ